ncbi:hypothetical protein [Endozoicomonas acroporae]|uniref:hypothetical protein n=1 Tax=Endozoicomonas acroporae TaxID=1701104 RepID=UPI003D795ED2
MNEPVEENIHGTLSTSHDENSWRKRFSHWFDQPLSTIRNDQTIIPLADIESNAPARSWTLMMEEQKRQAVYHNSRLGQILIKKGYISPEQLDAAIQRSTRPDQLLGEYLIEQRMLSRWQLRRALSSQSQLRLSASLSMALLTPVYPLLAKEHAEPIDSTLETLLKPLLIAGSADTLEFNPDLSTIEFRHNGLIRLRIPSTLGELNFDGLRLITDGSKNHLALSLADLELTDARLFIRTIHNQLDPALP